MSKQYDQYLIQHKANVAKGFEWIKANLPQYIPPAKVDAHMNPLGNDLDWQMEINHDYSKNRPEEYDAYDAYFYGGNQSFFVTKAFNKAWLLHIHSNPHHWQYWVLINDDPSEGTICIEIPFNYILEMICDWWAFSWASGNLMEIFDWYDQHKAYIQMADISRSAVEDILHNMRQKLENITMSGQSKFDHTGVGGE